MSDLEISKEMFFAEMGAFGMLFRGECPDETELNMMWEAWLRCKDLPNEDIAKEGLKCGEDIANLRKFAAGGVKVANG